MDSLAFGLNIIGSSLQYITYLILYHQTLPVVNLPPSLPPLPHLQAGSGQAYTWGESDHGKLGLTDGLLAFHRHPQEVILPEKVVEVAAGSAHTLFLTGESFIY